MRISRIFFDVIHTTAGKMTQADMYGKIRQYQGVHS